MSVVISKSIKAIDREAVHRICSGQVVLNLATAVKELVENSLDAGATVIEVRLKEFGSELIEVTDNGCGVESENFEGLTLKHHTSKLQNFSDLLTVETFGFRGEALSSLCALSQLSVTTRHQSSPCGTNLIFDRNGCISSSTSVARQIGTTICLENIFSTLPVRQKEFHRNLKREFAKMSQLLYAYCLVSTGVRITCTNQTKKGGRSTVIATQGCKSVRENIACVFGTKQLSSLLEISSENIANKMSIETLEELGLSEQDLSVFQINGFVSSCAHGQGRGAMDRQFYFINSRPCEPTKVSKVVSEVYHQYNQHQHPFVFLNITVARDAVDVNVTPDKRQIFLEHEKLLVHMVKTILLGAYENIPSTYTMNNVSIRLSTSPKKSSVAALSPAAILSQWRHSRDKRSAEEEVEEKKPVKQLRLDNIFSSKEDTSLKQVNGFVRSIQKREESVTEKEFATSSTEHQEDEVKEESDSIVKNTEHNITDQTELDLFNSSARKEISENIDNSGIEIKIKNTVYSGPTKEKSSISKLNGFKSEVVNIENVISLHSQLEHNAPNDSIQLTNENESTNFTKDLDVVNEVNCIKSKLLINSRNVEKNVENVNSVDGDCVNEHKVYVDSTESPDVRGRKCTVLDLNIDKLRKISLDRAESRNQNEKGNVRFRAVIDPSKNTQAEQELSREITKDMFSKMEVLGQFNLGFIIARLGSDLFIVDQHATDEKYNFETLQQTTTLSNQKLVVPQQLDLTAINECILVENIEVFKANGFEFKINEEAPVTKKISLTAIPMSRNCTFGKEDIDELLFMLQDSPHTLCRPSRVRAMFASRACRKSVMIGTALSRSEMKRLLVHMGEIEQPWNCPHGRPTMRHLINLDYI